MLLEVKYCMVSGQLLSSNCAALLSCVAPSRYNMRVVECRLAAMVLAVALGQDKARWVPGLACTLTTTYVHMVTDQICADSP